MSIVLPNGYKLKTTFFEDFSIADAFGSKAVKDTFRRAFKEWKNNPEYVTELSIVMNLKCWYWYEKDNIEYSELYSDYYYKVHYWCLDHLKGNDLQYYLNIID